MVICVFIVVDAVRACFVVAQDGVSWLCVSLIQQGSRTWRVAQVSRGCIFYCYFASSSLRVLLLFSMFSLREIWGMNMPNLPEVSCLEDLLVLACIRCTCVAAIDAPLRMIVVVGWVLSWYSQCSHDAFVAFVGKAALWLHHGSPHRIRRTLVSWVLWRFTMMALIASIVISDGFDCAHHDWRWCCCLLLLVATVPSSNVCIVFTARIFNSLITIQTELSLD